MIKTGLSLLTAFAFVLCVPAFAVDLNLGADKADDEIEELLQNCRVPEGLKLELFAAEPMLAHPVALCTDERGRIFVAELDRLLDPAKPVGHKDTGVLDNRAYTSFLDEDMACRTVSDRIAMLNRNLKEKAQELTIVSDRIRMIEDRDGDGKADHSTVFAEGFNKMEDGPAAGVLAHKGNIYFTDIPNLWLLKDTKNTGRADFRKVLQTGYGVRIAFLGHDLHGLILGPDGKLYFSIGDRGYNVTTEGHTIADNQCGAVFRCEQDGSGLEVISTGVRNPQGLAFDQYGNLFAGDNNCDKGDPCRLVWVLDGGDSGWRIGYQHIVEPNLTGPWHAEKLWSTHFDGMAAYILPPVAHVTLAGPSGFRYYPGTGLPSAYDNHFLICDYRGAKGCLISFSVKPKGASFELAEQQDFLTNLQATDVIFGTDGAVYTTVWYGPVARTDKGRIYRVSDPTLAHDAIVLETKKLLAEGFEKRSPAELTRLLAHQDMRIRQEAQFELADRGAIPEFSAVLSGSTNQLARIHAIWGLGQISRKKNSEVPVEPVVNVLNDPDMEVRAQAAKVVGECHARHGFDGLMAILKTGSPRAKLFAAMSLGKLGEPQALPAIIEMLRENNDKDAYLRHAGVMAMLWLCQKDLSASGVLAFMEDKSSAVRMAVLLMLRRLKNPEIGAFLHDSDPKLIVEAARAINDVPINAAMPALAALINNEPWKFNKLSPGDMFTAERWSPETKKSEAESKPALASEQVLLKKAEYSAPRNDPRGLRISGVLPVMMSGQYTFWVTGSDHSELWLSTDDKPENKHMIALCKSKSDLQGWGQPEQQSYPVMLNAGSRYYIEGVLFKSPPPPVADASKKEAVKKDKTHDKPERDQLAFGWRFPNNRTQRPIAEIGSDDLTALLRRVLNANFRLGGNDNAEALAHFAVQPEYATSLRAEALTHLANWSSPPPKDAIVNLWRPLTGNARDPDVAVSAIYPLLRGLLNHEKEEIQCAAAIAAGNLNINAVGPALYDVATHDKWNVQPRIYALDALAAMKNENLVPAIRICLEAPESRLRQESLNLLADFDPAVALPLLKTTLERPDMSEKQNALGILAKINNTAANEMIAASMHQLLNQTAEPEVALDILEAAQASSDDNVKQLAEKYKSTLPPFNELAPFAVSLKGGNADLGRKLFYESSTAQCIRCHKINGYGGDVGPDLKGIGSRKDRAYILESMILPSAQIALGFETVLVKLKDGRVITGTIRKEDENELVVASAEGKTTKIKKEDIAKRASQKISTMPPMGELLTKREIRNLVEFLANLK